ncbi:hypothetical protein EHQ96_08745 [Leptospira levettii]|uniref:hypothetical protein n=1 Tax=Leptospira levettii TaxID=2023178 RepID=UPI0010838171|nr:hypothetical protein [Leptospira levettii]TGM69597.1 hypothetical protein EHQ96_08745 [Leptospira levettii]
MFLSLQYQSNGFLHSRIKCFSNAYNSTVSAPTGIWTGIKNNPSWQDSRAIAITSAYGNGGTLNNLLCLEQ